MNFVDRLQSIEKTKEELLLVTFFVTIYENFMSKRKEEILAFYANECRSKNGKLVYEFVKINNDNNNTKDEKYSFKRDIDAENQYKREVYQQVHKSNGKGYDNEASMFKWLLSRELIKKEHFNQLLEIRRLRNKLVHELDTLLNDGFPKELDVRIKELIEIRKYSSKMWFIYTVLPTTDDIEIGNNGNIVLPDNVYSFADMAYDLLYNALFLDKKID